MIGYQFDAAAREFAALKGRALLLVLQVVVTAVSLSFTLNNTVRAVNNLSLAASLTTSQVTYFEASEEDEEAFTLTDDLDAALTAVLDGDTRDYSLVKNNYFPDEPLAAPVLVALGGFADAYELDAEQAATPRLVIGANVTGYDIGDWVDLGGIGYEVTGRLPSGSAYLDPWMGHESLDDTIILLSTYQHFAEHTPPGVWQPELASRTVLFDATDTAITSYVDAANSSGGLHMEPRSLDERVESVYQAKTGKNAMFLLFFGCLLLVMLATITSSVGSLVTSNLRRYAIERIYGARLGHITLRVSLFITASFTAPAAAIFTFFALIAPGATRFLPIALATIFTIHALLCAHALRLLSRMSITNLLRTE